jgi:uncharacterized protein YjbI with pentapeptide repeats
MSRDDAAEHPTASAPRELRIMPWWLVVVALVVAVLAGWFVISWLLGEADEGTVRAQARIDAVRTGLTVIAGTGGAAGLVLAARRQWLSERTQRHQEQVAVEGRDHQDRVQTHQEQVAAQSRRHSEHLAERSEYDATERRITDLYTKAVDLLGSERAAVRLGGLHALERLAGDHPPHRQTIVDLICAYLRMAVGESTDAGAEGQVRRTAAQILTRHLRPGDESLFWPGTRLDLSGAELRDFDAAGCVFAETNFEGAVFAGDTNFTDAAFDGLVRLGGALFAEGAALFHRLDCRAEAAFSGVTFECPAEFDDAVFARSASFAAATFSQGASFRRATFEDTGTFDRAVFAGVSFRGVGFHRGASFEHAVFEGQASFYRVHFHDLAMFRRAAFHGDLTLEYAEFDEAAAFARAVFHESVTFTGARLSRQPNFEDTRAAASAYHVWPPGWRGVTLEEGWLSLTRDGRSGS